MTGACESIFVLCLHLYHPPPSTCSYDYVDNFAVHLWTSADPGHRERLSRLSMDDLFFGNGSFHRVARTLVREAEARGALCGYASAQVRAWEGGGGVAGPAGRAAKQARVSRV